MFARRQAPIDRRMENNKRTHFNPMGSTGASSLRAPIVRIEDHNSAVLSCDFHPSGKFLLASNRNGQIRVCDINGAFTKAMVLKGHTRAVMEARFSEDGFNVYSASLDGTVGIWDTFRGFRRAKLVGHKAGVNCIQATKSINPLLCSGSNDGTVRLWDARKQDATQTLRTYVDVTATCFSDDENFLFCGGLSSDISVWDLRSRKVVYQLLGHKAKVTGLSLSPCGSYLLSHSVDSTLKIWNVRSNVTQERCVRTIASYQHYADGLLRCAWSPDGSMISAGTSDRDVYVWDALTGKTIYSLPGHEANINDVAFSPKEPVVLSASNDNYLFLHEMSNPIE